MDITDLQHRAFRVALRIIDLVFFIDLVFYHVHLAYVEELGEAGPEQGHLLLDVLPEQALIDGGAQLLSICVSEVITLVLLLWVFVVAA